MFGELDRERDTNDRARAPEFVADTLRALAESNTLDNVVFALSKFISFRFVGPRVLRQIGCGVRFRR